MMPIALWGDRHQSRFRRAASAANAARVEPLRNPEGICAGSPDFGDPTRTGAPRLAPRASHSPLGRLACLPGAGSAAAHPNLACILARPVDWTLVEQQHDALVRCTNTMAGHTADPEAILRRFTRSNVQHPTYKVLAELGKAVKTVFLCRSLGDEAPRREIHEKLNVVETWNSANGLIFFGKGGEVASNRLDDQEASVHALHLPQSCLADVNTLMPQRVLAEPDGMARMTSADMRGLTPLIWGHVSPYRTFGLDAAPHGVADGHERAKDFLTEGEVARLLDAAKGGRHGMRDPPAAAHGVSPRPAGQRGCRPAPRRAGPRPCPAVGASPQGRPVRRAAGRRR